MKKLAFTVAMFSISTAFGADVLTLIPGTNAINGVTLANSAVLNETHSALTPIGAGLRTKSVVFIPVKVYVAELFSSDAAHFDRTETGAVNSPNEAGSTTALTLTMVRGVSMSDMQSAFEDGFKSNNVDPSDSDIQNFLTAFQAGGDAANGGTMTIVGERLPDGDHVIYESTSGYQKELVGKDGFVKNIFSIWLGQSADGGLATLKSSLLNSSTISQ